MANYTFRPMGNTTLIAVTTAPTAAVQPSTGSVGGFMVTNMSTIDAWLSVGSSTISAAYATTAVAANAIPITGGGVAGGLHTMQILAAQPNFYVSAVTSGAGTAAILAVTPGLSL